MFKQNLMLALPRKHARAKAGRASLKEFLDEALTLPSAEYDTGLRDVILTTFANHGGVPKRLQIVERIATALSFIANGLGIGLVPRSSRSLQTRSVVFLPIVPPQLSVVYAVWRSNDRSVLRSALRDCLIYR